MNKSLAQRVSDQTHRVMETRQKEEENKEAIFNFLEKRIRQKGKSGGYIFVDIVEKKHLNITIENVMNEVGLSYFDTEKALKGLGFEVENFLDFNLITIRDEPTERIQKLLDEHEQLVNEYLRREEMLAEDNFKQVIQKLENWEYEVIGVDNVIVKFDDTAKHPRLYENCIRDKMRAEGFNVKVLVDRWLISVIQERGE